MSDVIIVAIITLVGTVLGNYMVAKANARDLYNKLDKDSALSDTRLDAKLEKYQAVMDAKIEELAREVRRHNNFAEKFPVLEERVRQLENNNGGKAS